MENANDEVTADTQPSTTTILKQLALSGLKIAKEAELLLVAPSQQYMLEHLDGRNPQHLSQYYSDKQISDICSAFSYIGFSVTLFRSESEFLNWATTKLQSAPREKFIVYAVGECGFGPGRRALIPAFCQYYDLAYINSGPTANCLARNKWLVYSILCQHGIKTPKTWHYNRRTGWFQDAKPPEGKVIIVKPNFESMCVGIEESSVFPWSKGREGEIEEIAGSFDDEVVVQEFITGLELGSPVIATGQGVRAIGCVGYRHKHLPNECWGKPRTNLDECTSGTVVNYNPKFSDSLVPKKIMKSAEYAAQLLMFRGFARIDFRLDENNEPFVIDTNESPPPIMQSALGYLLQKLEFSHHDFLAMLAGLSSNRV